MLNCDDKILDFIRKEKKDRVKFELKKNRLELLYKFADVERYFNFNKIIKDWEVDEEGNPTFDYILETGDISQNGRRRNEYHGYFEGLQGWNRRLPIMSCMG